MVVFLKCRRGDLREKEEMPSRPRKAKKNYVEVSDEDEDEDSLGEGPSGTISGAKALPQPDLEGDEDSEGEGPRGATGKANLKASESDDTEDSRGDAPSGTIGKAEPEADSCSPAGNAGSIASQLKFLRSLCQAQVYQDFASSVAELKGFPVSLVRYFMPVANGDYFKRLEGAFSLGDWCSWASRSICLPAELHSEPSLLEALSKITALLPSSSSRDRMILLCLALGLLLRDVARVVEQEPDAELPPVAPHFINSPFTHHHIDQVLNVVGLANKRLAALSKGKHRPNAPFDKVSPCKISNTIPYRRYRTLVHPLLCQRDLLLLIHPPPALLPQLPPAMLLPHPESHLHFRQ